MRAISLRMVVCLILVYTGVSLANDACILGSYEQSQSDIIVLDSISRDRVIFYNLGSLAGNNVEYIFRYGNLNTLGSAFGDSVTGGAISICYGQSELARIINIVNGDFIEDTIRVNTSLDSLSVSVRADSISDPIIICKSRLLVTDSIPPAAISDLRINATYHSALLLAWTIPGDDIEIGNAALYDIRYSYVSPYPDTAAWWDSATSMTSIPEPGVPGDSQSTMLSGLFPDSTYYIMMVTYDELGNRSAYSNVVSGIPQGSLINNCLYFDGNQYCTVPYNMVLNPTSAMTIEAWFYLDGDYTWNHAAILDKAEPHHNMPFYQYNFGPANHTDFYAQMAVDNQYFPFEDFHVVTPDTWTHAAVTFDGAKQRLYINGVQIDSIVGAGVIDTFSTGLRIGAYQNVEGNNFKGYLDEIRIWGIARSGDQINSGKNHLLRGDEPGLAAYWRFDDGIGQSILDCSTHGVNGVLGISPAVESEDPDWRPSTAPVDSQYVSINDRVTPQMQAGLLKNYPNPFNDQTLISFSLSADSPVKLEIFDILGRRILVIVDDFFKAGEHSLLWDGKSGSGVDMASGLYYYRLQTNTLDLTKKMLKLR
jgi:hypothetical protein